MITVTKNAKVLSAISKPYKFKDEKGVEREGDSHKVRLNIEGEIYEFKSTAQQVSSLQAKVNDEIEVEISFSSPKEVLKSQIVSFE